MKRAEIVPFGKYKGQPVEVLARDREYAEWLMAQDWFRERYGNVYTLIVNNFGEPAETPEHNQLQALFTDAEFCRKFVWHLESAIILSAFAKSQKRCLDTVAKRSEELRTEIEGKRLRDLPKAVQELEEDDGGKEYESRYKQGRVERLGKEIVAARKALEETETVRKTIAAAPPPLPAAVKSKVEFEVRGIDVVLAYSVSGFLDEYDYRNGRNETLFRAFRDTLHVECKPSLSDDYPAVLRQIASYQEDDVAATRVVLVGNGGYTGTGATLEQVKAIFESRKVQIVFLRDIV